MHAHIALARTSLHNRRQMQPNSLLDEAEQTGYVKEQRLLVDVHLK